MQQKRIPLHPTFVTITESAADPDYTVPAGKRLYIVGISSGVPPAQLKRAYIQVNGVRVFEANPGAVRWCPDTQLYFGPGVQLTVADDLGGSETAVAYGLLFDD